MQIPEKQLLILAIEDYLRRHHEQELLNSINEAYADGLDPSEQVMLEGMRQHHRHLAATLAVGCVAIYNPQNNRLSRSDAPY